MAEEKRAPVHPGESCWRASCAPWRSAALRFGRLSGTLMRAGRRPPVIDTLPAATAIEHGLVQVTRSVKDVAPTGARPLDSWAAGGTARIGLKS